jgi:hypothetical protein
MNMQKIQSILLIASLFVSAMWFIYNIEKRIALLEQNNMIMTKNLNEMQLTIAKDNEAQDKAFLRFQDSVTNKLNRMEDKIDTLLERRIHK